MADIHDLEPKVAELIQWARTRSDDKELGLGYHPDLVVPILLARLIRDVEMMLPKLSAIQASLEALEREKG